VLSSTYTVYETDAKSTAEGTHRESQSQGRILALEVRKAFSGGVKEPGAGGEEVAAATLLLGSSRGLSP